MDIDAPAVERTECAQNEIAFHAQPALLASAAISAMALAGCGGGGGGGSAPVVIQSTATPSPTPATPTPAPITAEQAGRFLAQSAMGASASDVAQVQQSGYSAWIDAQFALSRAITHWDWLVAKGYNAAANMNGTAGFDNMMWHQLIAEPDQLRQRIGMALSEILVVGIDGVNLNWRSFAMASYLDILLDNAFGNFRDILQKISTNVAMGAYLTFLNNRKANSATGSVPDENYARELMQLYTIGLYQLNMDGTRKLSGGQPIETYTQADVSGLARVFTGLVLDSSDNTTPDRIRRPLIMNASQHESGAATFLGTTIPSGTEGMAAISLALDAIFAHENIPPFIASQLIIKLVTSNPSPAYVGRVAAVFANNGAGVRGDMKAVIRAVLLDNEARNVPAAMTAGKLREPVMRLTAWARAFGAASASGAWAIGDTSSSSIRLAQSAGRSSSVFNFFRPGYSPPSTAISAGGLIAPEFQITNELSNIAYINFMQLLVTNTVGDVRAVYDDLVALTDSQALVDAVNVRLAAGQISAATRATIKAAVDSIANGTSKVHAAVLLTLASPEFITLK